MSTAPRPPGLARRLLAALAEPDDRPWMLGDLDERFLDQCDAHDTAAARAWYWSQVLRSIAPLVHRRMRSHPANDPRRQPTASDSMMSTLAADARHAVRVAMRSPAPTIAVLTTLALGIGTAAAVWGAVWKIVLQPLPIPDPSHVVALFASSRRFPGQNQLSYRDFSDWRDRARSFSAMAGYTNGETTLAGDHGPVALNTVSVTDGFWTVLGATPAAGRLFTAADYSSGAAQSVVLSYEFWQRQFDGDRGLIGKAIQLSSGPATVVGVLAAGQFVVPHTGADLWAPLQVPTTGPNAWMNQRSSHWLNGVARVRPMVDVAAAAEELRTVERGVIADFPPPGKDTAHAGMISLQEYVAGPVRTTLLFLAAAVVLVLVLVSANIANLRLAQAHARQHEFALRAVLGAGDTRLVRMVATESMLLALVGGLLGAAIGGPILRGLIALYPGQLPRANEIHLDAATLIGTMLVALGAGAAFAIPQVLELLRADAGRLIKAGERGLGTRGHRRLRAALVVVQLSLSVVMLVLGGLLLRTFWNVSRVTPGFSPTGVVTFAVAPSPVRYPTPVSTEVMFGDLLGRLRALPGVKSVGAANAVPLTQNPWGDGIVIPGNESGGHVDVNVRLLTPGYLETMRVPLRRGRMIEALDDENAAPAMVINETLAEALYPGQDPIGKVVPFENASRTIVGVVGNLHQTSLTAAPDREVYVPYRQMPLKRARFIAVRTDGDPAALIGAIRRETNAVDPGLAIRNLLFMDALVSKAMAPQRFRATLIGSLALLALVLAVVGVYGVMTFAVSQRTREFGIRMALGEAPGHVRARILREALSLSAAGIAVGVGGVALIVHALSGFVFGVRLFDPVTLVGVPALLVGVTLIAADAPARRAGSIDPLAAIRNE